MNNLYIIGNGFDLAHGVDTCYWNFRTFPEREHWEFLLRFEALYGIQPLDDTEYGYTKEAQKRWETRVNKNLWSEFERFMARPDIQSMLSIAALTVYDMCKAVQKDMVITDIRLLSKTGGVHGDYFREE